MPSCGHPHPLSAHDGQQGCDHVARALREAGIPTLRFNFRGVGASGGEFDHGAAKRDAQAVAAWEASAGPAGRGSSRDFPSAPASPCAWLTRAGAPSDRGRSGDSTARSPFGAGSALSVADHPGDADEIVDPAAVIEWWAKSSQSRGW